MEIGDLREALLNQGITAEDQVIVEGQTEPLVQSAEQAVFTPEGYVRRRVMRVTQCAGCLSLFHQAGAAGSVCVDCGRTLCLSCSQTVCADPYCRKPVCPDDYTLWWDGPLCRWHNWLRVRGYIIRALVMASCLGGLVYLLFNS